jgi:hypothetical protein
VQVQINVLDFLSNFPSQDPCPRLLIEKEGLEFTVKINAVEKSKKMDEKNFMIYPLVDENSSAQFGKILKVATLIC